MGNEMETPRENDKLTLEQPAQGIDEKIHKDSKPSELKLNPHKNKRLTKDSVRLHSQELMEMMMKYFFQRKEKDRKWEK